MVAMDISSRSEHFRELVISLIIGEGKDSGRSLSDIKSSAVHPSKETLAHHRPSSAAMHIQRYA